MCVTVCVCVCVCARVYVCVCVCVCERERERERTRDDDKRVRETHSLIGFIQRLCHFLSLSVLSLGLSPRLSLFPCGNLFEPQSDGILFIQSVQK